MRSCTNCAYGLFERNEEGHTEMKQGKCLAPAPSFPNIPACMSVKTRRISIWPDDTYGKNCPCWKTDKQPVSGAMTDEEIKERIDQVDFSQMVTADDVFYLIARAIEKHFLSASGQAVSEREAEIDRLAWNEALSAAARYVNGRLAGRTEGSELWLELGKIERGIRALASTPAQQTEAQNANPWKDAIDYQLVLMESTADSYATPGEAVKALLDWHVAVALDPRVSEAARKLQTEVIAKEKAK